MAGLASAFPGFIKIGECSALLGPVSNPDDLVTEHFQRLVLQCCVEERVEEGSQNAIEVPDNVSNELAISNVHRKSLKKREPLKILPTF